MLAPVSGVPRWAAVMLVVGLAAGPVPLLPQSAGGGLTERGVENLLAFARLYGYVRFFHPSDAAPEADWSAVAVEGARQAESAPTSEALAQALGRVFAEVAPAVRVFATARPVPPPPPERPADSAGTGIAYWNHYGVRMGPQSNIYDSRWMIVPLAERPTDLPEPAQPYRLELPGGVSAWVPGSRFVSLPAATEARVRRPVPDTALTRFSATDRAVRLGAVIIIWNVVQHFYPYFDVVVTDWSGALPRGLQQAALDADPEAFERTLKRLMAQLRDGHAGANIQPWRPFAAPPVEARWIEDRLVVTAVDSSMADRIARGDVISRFDGEPVERVLARQDSLSFGASQAVVRFVSIRTLLAGRPGSGFSVALEPNGSLPGRSLELRRDLPMIAYEPRPDSVSELQPGIWYFDLTRANDSLFFTALPRLASARGIVFDLRGYPVTTPRILRHFIGDTTRWGGHQMSIPTVLRPDRERMLFSFVNPWVIPPAAPRLQGSVVFLTNAEAGSYAESLLDLIEEHRLGVIVGSPSAGTNGNNNPFLVPGGYRVSFTGMRVVRHDGSRLHGVGIAPAVRVTPTIAGIRAGRDEVLEKGLEVLTHPPR